MTGSMRHGSWTGRSKAPALAASWKVLLLVLSSRRYRQLGQPSSHKSKALRQFVRSVDPKLFLLPKYSADLNPIEQSLPSSSTCFAKLRPNSRCGLRRTHLHPKNAPTISRIQVIERRYGQDLGEQGLRPQAAATLRRNCLGGTAAAAAATSRVGIGNPVARPFGAFLTRLAIDADFISEG